MTEIAFENVVSEAFSFGLNSQISRNLPPMALSTDMPIDFSDIKSEARLWFGIKGTNALKQYLAIKQMGILGYNAVLDFGSYLIESTVR